MVMAGPGPLRAALAEKPAPAQLRADIENFAAALAATDDDQADPYDDMHAALELALTEEPDLNERIRYLLAVTGLAARLTDTDVNPRRAMKGDVSTPGMLTHYLLVEPAMHAALVLHRDDDDAAVRARMLSLAAQVAPVAAGDLAAEFPGLAGDDPRLEPASRARALRWIEKALQLALEKDRAINGKVDLNSSADANALVRAVTATLGLPGEWPIHRLVSASAEAAAAILHAVEAAELAEEVFTES